MTYERCARCGKYYPQGQDHSCPRRRYIALWWNPENKRIFVDYSYTRSAKRFIMNTMVKPRNGTVVHIYDIKHKFKDSVKYIELPYGGSMFVNNNEYMVTNILSHQDWYINDEGWPRLGGIK